MRWGAYETSFGAHCRAEAFLLNLIQSQGDPACGSLRCSKGWYSISSAVGLWGTRSRTLGGCLDCSEYPVYYVFSHTYTRMKFNL